MLKERARVWYVPHHPVFHPLKKKVRMVFDCAAVTDGVCLNDYLHTGPDLTNKLIGVLLRFRNYPIAIVADIEAMFHQVWVSNEDIHCLRFLWSDDIHNSLALTRMKCLFMYLELVIRHVVHHLH